MSKLSDTITCKAIRNIASETTRNKGDQRCQNRREEAPPGRMCIRGEEAVCGMALAYPWAEHCWFLAYHVSSCNRINRRHKHFTTAGKENTAATGWYPMRRSVSHATTSAIFIALFLYIHRKDTTLRFLCYWYFFFLHNNHVINLTITASWLTGRFTYRGNGCHK